MFNTNYVLNEKHNTIECLEDAIRSNKTPTYFTGSFVDIKGLLEKSPKPLFKRMWQKILEVGIYNCEKEQDLKYLEHMDELLDNFLLGETFYSSLFKVLACSMDIKTKLSDEIFHKSIIVVPASRNASKDIKERFKFG